MPSLRRPKRVENKTRKVSNWKTPAETFPDRTLIERDSPVTFSLEDRGIRLPRLLIQRHVWKAHRHLPENKLNCPGNE
ncbi:hypothetical protein AVEN_228690-1 [Araneus ventricosus]|uniref:Uncharacterized protein n=1 Tax=Araneus ventricosus TaxID=182803 RepID=A0A4Y2P4K5_ARAVE|nr:hypothetical protein AVEN_228690-1 [Araneus ventricosus]